MARDLEIIGPVPIPYLQSKKGPFKHIGIREAEEFWQDQCATVAAYKQGCYVFAIRAGRGFTPWYVGKTKRSMKKEIFESHKLAHYNGALFGQQHGRPFMFFVVPAGRKKKVPEKVSDEIETLLIQMALKENPGVRNTQKAQNVKRWTIRGVVRGGPGKPGRVESQFKKMMGL